MRKVRWGNNGCQPGFPTTTVLPKHPNPCRRRFKSVEVADCYLLTTIRGREDLQRSVVCDVTKLPVQYKENMVHCWLGSIASHGAMSRPTGKLDCDSYTDQASEDTKRSELAMRLEIFRRMCCVVLCCVMLCCVGEKGL